MDPFSPDLATKPFSVRNLWAAGCAKVKRGDGPQALAQLPWWNRVEAALVQGRLEEMKEGGRGGILSRRGRALDWEGRRPSHRSLWKRAERSLGGQAGGAAQSLFFPVLLTSLNKEGRELG